MNANVTLANRRMITPIVAVLVAIAFAATLALGFALRAWTEHTAEPSPAAAVVDQVRPAVPLAPVRMGKPW